MLARRPQEAPRPVMLGRSARELDLSHAGESVPSYCAVPADGRGKGLLVLAVWPDRTAFARDVCDRLARAGFVALAPDLGAGSGDEASVIEIERVDAVTDAAVDALLGCDATVGARVGAVGFGAGGVLALRAAARQRRVGAVVDFYGVSDTTLLGDVSLAGAAAPVLCVFGEADPALEDGTAEAFEAQLAAAGLRVHLERLPHAGEGFLNETRADVFDAVAAAHAWDAALAFFGAEL
jgi:carboxymethylenebutenolidase